MNEDGQVTKYWSNVRIGFLTSSCRSALEFNPYGHVGRSGTTKLLGEVFPVCRDAKNWITVKAHAQMSKSRNSAHEIIGPHNRICRPAISSPLRVWTWNIETLACPGFLSLMSDLATAHSIDAIFFQETRWRGYSSFGLARGWWFVGIADGKGNDGVAVLMIRKLRAALLGFKFISGRLLGVQYRTCAGPPLFLNGHAPSEDAPSAKKDTFWNDVTREIKQWSEALPTFLFGDLNVRWEAKLPHEAPLLGPWTAGKGKDYLVSRPMLDNRSRAWECLAQHQLIDLNSHYRKSWSKASSYCEIGTPTNIPPTPSNSASLDRAWTRLHQRRYVTDVEVARPWFLSHHSPLRITLAINTKKPSSAEAIGAFDMSKLTRGTDAPLLSAALRSELNRELPDPHDSNISLADFHHKAISAAVCALEPVLGRKKPDPKF